ncbi:MAG TPA: ABC transporter permease [Mobilitalea sp.]|nr:ABC transporter permease [Mobilitalea sp.]
MYLRILKKDLKQKKTMNIILLLFIILASTFIASSMNNLISISTAMESYFEKADLKDLTIITLQDKENDAAIINFLKNDSNVESWSQDENLYITDDNLSLSNGNKFSLATTVILSSINIQQQKFFDKHNNEIVDMKDGEIYIPTRLMEDNDLNVGDVITFSEGDLHIDYTISGSCKDALLGSTMMGVSRFIISDNDYKKIRANTELSCGNMYSVNTSDLNQLEKNYNQMGFNVIASCNQKLVSTTYIMDMMIAGLLLIVSVCLILISMLILRFTIVFTLSEEYREIGIMKAIGIGERKIRGLYIIKYLAISIMGSAIGFICSIPFGSMLINKVSKNIIITNENGLFINLIFSGLIIIIIVLFCYFCTRKVNKFSPVEAIRNGSNGERYKKKGFLRLSRSRGAAIVYMAWNDILSEPKKFGALILTFTLGIILIIEPLNTINTMNSNQMVTMFGMVESDVYLTNEGQQNKFIKDGRDYIEEYLPDMQMKLKDNGIDATVYCEMAFKIAISKESLSFISFSLQGNGTTADQYTYTKGQPPEYENEVALSQLTADKVGAKIGDTVKIKNGESKNDFIVTGLYQSMNNMGEGIRFHEKAEVDYKYAFAGFALQIKYNDNPSKERVQKRFDEMKELFPDFNVYTGGEYVNEMTGDVSGQLNDVKGIIVAVIIIINMLVSVLMVKSFITKEKGEIGMLKSIGFCNSAIIKWQILRIGIIMIISTLLAILLSNPIAQISTAKVFEMMGGTNMKFVIKPLEVYVIYPLTIFIMAMLASIIAAAQIINISVQETNNIE